MESNKKVVLITGCSSGIGLALAKQFAEVGFMVCATMLDLCEADCLKNKNIEVFQLDVTDEQSIENCMSQVKEKFSHIDILVNNAGYGLIKPVLDLSLSELRKQYETNVFGPINLIKRIGKDMALQGKGTIVNFSSISAELTTPFSAAYTGSKAALFKTSETLKMELAPFGVRVITVLPGAIATNFGKNAVKPDVNANQKESLYSSLVDKINARAQSHMNKPTSADEFAEKLVAEILKKMCPDVIRIGSGWSKYRLLRAILPKRVIENILKKQYGLDTLERNMLQAK